MIVFKVLLIILISAPAVALGWFLFAQVNEFVKRRNAADRQRAAGGGRRRG